jgi:hypothetical protein
VFNPEMSRALADQRVRDLHRRAASYVPFDAPASPVAQHWLVLAARLHLRRPSTGATAPVLPGTSQASRPSGASGAPAPTPPRSACARQPMGCVA